MKNDTEAEGELRKIPSNDEAMVIIEGFTLQDFLSAEGAPFKWLYSFRGSPFAFNRFKLLLAEQARRVHVGNFASLCKGYADSNQVVTPREETMTMFSGQRQPLLSGIYTCTDEGVVCYAEKGGMETVCPHPIMPVERLVNIETGEVKIRIAYKRGVRWREAVVDKATLSSARNIVSLASCGIGVTSESAKSLVKYLAYMEDRNYDAIPEKKMIDRLGWVEDEGFSPFIPGLEYDSGGQFVDEFKAIRTGGSYEAWLDLARTARARGPTSTRIALAASFASVLVKKFNALPFIVHLWGSISGIGKSVALILAGSVWAYPEIGYYIKTTKATDVALEQLAFFAGNMPLCLDELQLIQNRKNFDETIYALCEGIGKSRGAKTGGLQTVRRWCNAIITTGEQPVVAANSKAGAVNRVLEIECTEPTFDNPREAYQLLVHNYGWAGRDFVEKLQQDDSLIDEARRLQQDAYRQLEGKATDKQVLTGSILLAADAMAERLIFHDGVVLTAEDIQPYLISRESADTNRRAYDWLCDWIASNPLKFKAQNDLYAGECWGKLEYDSEENPIRACIIRSVFDRALTEAGFNPASFLSWAAKECRIARSERESNRHCTMARRLVKGGPLVRCVVLILPEEDMTTEESMEGFETVQTELPFG